MGAERRSSYIDEKVKRLTAYHEGGHALTALYTDGAMPLHKVTCVPRGHALGIVGLIRCRPLVLPTQNADKRGVFNHADVPTTERRQADGDTEGVFG